MEAYQHKPYKMPRDFDGIEEVSDSSERSNGTEVDGGTVGLSGIEEVDENTPQQLNNTIDGSEVAVRSRNYFFSKKPSVINGGTVSLKEESEASHKAKMRQVITITTLILWVIWTIVGLVVFVHTGNPLLIIASPTTIAGMPLYRILSKIVKFFF